MNERQTRLPLKVEMLAIIGEACSDCRKNRESARVVNDAAAPASSNPGADPLMTDPPAPRAVAVPRDAGR